MALTRAVDTVCVVESDTSHPLLGLLRIVWSEDLSLVSANASSLEEWQKEARKLELQGKQEQADAIRKNIVRVAPVPWPLLDRPGFRQAYERSFAPGSVFVVDLVPRFRRSDGCFARTASPSNRGPLDGLLGFAQTRKSLARLS